jgi:5-methylcytosine-specific restriction enzyme subunit McrC
MSQTINLFEYENKVKFPGTKAELAGLVAYLDEIWVNRDFEESQYKKSKSQKQQFLKISRSDKIISQNYVGIIRYGNITINLLPKIFYKESYLTEPETCPLNEIQKHIFWWLSYTERYKFPKNILHSSSHEDDLWEVMVYQFAKFTDTLFSNNAYCSYEEIENELNYLRGSINYPAYIRENLQTGRWHKFNCRYDSFEFDNKFNRIVKFTCKLLVNQTKKEDSRKLLKDILFILDEVSDERFTAQDCECIEFNSLFEDFEIVRDYCTFFLSNSILFEYKDELKIFAFLIDMNKLFEEFLKGFMRHELRWDVVKGDNKFDTTGVYKLEPDFHIKKHNVIADAKYKKPKDAVKPISKDVLYQMMAYSECFEVDTIQLIYPKYLGCGEEQCTAELTVNSKRKTKIKLKRVTVINPDFGQTPENDFPNNVVEILKKELSEYLL